MRMLMDDADLRRRMGLAGRERVLEMFNWRKAALATEAVYREVLGGKPAPEGAPEPRPPA
jgi:glycosyltransferase involved in cell wall biosynthesis